jgi:hypothetical protein
MSDVREVRVGKGVFAFDGRVLEVFGGGNESRRFHVATIEALRRDGSALEVKVRGEPNTYFSLKADDPAAIEALLADVEAAIAAGGGA